MRFAVLIEVRLREGLPDPQGNTIAQALPALGFQQVTKVTVGKAIRLFVDADSETQARATLNRLCLELLANPIIEETEVLSLVAS
ncbi:MAG: phosphoribosylformylglycinamidine synthase subunit PurS [Actinobacteria bacterium]|nr:phosphoribosylformylglycinamidine synthase subunit PurS [Actinomycetota bacterium]MCL6104028.1 phosphoribosylformylglycinamidine synthase subunit PurS [Actinomycetota bacterium]